MISAGLWRHYFDDIVMENLRLFFPVLLTGLLVLFFTSGCSYPGRGVVHDYGLTEKTVSMWEDEIIEDEADPECSYFYFLWGRYAEVNGLFDEALEAYEKALICDPESTWIAKKLPLLLLRLGRVDEAEKQLHQYLLSNPDDITARMILARFFVRKKLYEKAIEQYNDIYRKHPGEHRSLLLIGELYLGLQRFDEARKMLDKFISISDDPYYGHVLLARLSVYENKFEQAIDHYKAALEINWSSGLELELAGVYLRNRKYTEAEKLYKRLLSRDELDEKAGISLVRVYLLQGKVQKAREELTRLRGISADLEQLELSLAGIHIRREQFDKAIDILQGLLLREDSYLAHYLLGISFVKENQYEEALVELEQISSEAEEYVGAVLLQVRILNFLQRSEEGILILEEILAANGGQFVDMFILLANMYEQHGDNEAGEDTFNRAVSIHPENAELFYEFALFIDRQGEMMRAVTMMKKVISLNPDHAGALNFVGYTWADRGENLEKALEYIKRAVSLRPENGYIRDSLGWVYYRLGHLDKAKQELEKALELVPDDPEILEHLGEVYIKSGLREKGLEAYRRAVQFFERDEDRQRVMEKIRTVEEGDGA